MIAAAGLRSGLIALLSTLVSILAFVIWPAGAQAQLVDTPANLVKAWADAYATRLGEPMGRVYASDAQLWGSQSKEASSGLAKWCSRCFPNKSGPGSATPLIKVSWRCLDFLD